MVELDGHRWLLASVVFGTLLETDLSARTVRVLPGAAMHEFPRTSARLFKSPRGDTLTAWRAPKIATYANVNVHALGPDVFILGGTAEPHRLQLIDVHDRTSLRYRCSFTMPSRVYGLGSDPSGALVVTHWEPEPHISRYKLEMRKCS